MTTPHTKDDAPEDFAALMAEFDKKAPRGRAREPQVGDVVRGRVISVGQDAVFVELEGSKTEAMLDLQELHDSEGKLVVKVGDAVEARVVEVAGKAGCVVLRRSAARGTEARAELAQAAQTGLPVEGKVTAVNKGGVDVDVAGVRGFCPISQLDRRPVDDASVFVGQKMLFRVTKYEADRRGANLVLSRRVLIEEENRTRAQETRSKLTVGAVLSGEVVAIKDFGAFVDLGGIEGMLPASQISFARGTRPADVLAVGQRLEVQVLRIEKTDDPKRPERISLSLKSLADDPWDQALQRFAPGTKVTGPVTHVEPFGAFVELAPGIEGLVHISELTGGKQARHAREVIKPGASIEVTVLAIDREKRRVSLGVGDRPDAVDAEGLATARAMAGGGRLGTLGDLLKKKL